MSFKPQFAYSTPAGFRDEPFIVPFIFTIPGDGLLQRQLPWQLDDDQPFIIRGISFSQIGENSQSVSPGLCRIWDTIGNPLSKDLVLGLGQWANGSQDGQGAVFANGFPIEPDVECAPGGALFFDFQIQTTEFVATTQLVGGAGGSIILVAGIMGTGGNGRTITLVDPGAPNSALAVSVVGVNVSVSLETDGAGVIITTYSELAQAINDDPDTYGVMSGFFDPLSDDGPVDPVAATVLDGGTAATPITLLGSLYGVKRFREC